MVERFTPFPDPARSGDKPPLVVADGPDYRCSGCGGRVPSGVLLHEIIEDGMVVGLTARQADGSVTPVHQGAFAPHTAVADPSGPVVHQCGAAVPQPEPEPGD